ncbi:DNA repair protein RAD16-like isoform X1 [Apium graveolens]|uniref:DNA repair protein RAD16-like isoform X1 n=1 Tax=Apium graveolens TaxID=4045 RepID=UPI003D7970A6
MKLRSRDSGPSNQGDDLQFTESSEEDSDPMDADPDFDGVDREGEDFLSMIEENGGLSGVKLDQYPETVIELSDDEDFVSDSDLDDNVSKKRKVGPKKKRGRKSQKTEVTNKAVVTTQGNWVDTSNYGVQEVPEIIVDASVEFNIRRRRKKRKGKDKPILMWEVWEEEHERWVAAHINADTDLDNQNDVVAETAEASPNLIMPLLRYQKEWLAWALQQEESAARGGILADEMGMGKTVQAIALVLAKQDHKRTFCESNGVSSQPSSSSGLPEVKATLVICPLVAVIQWVNEIDRFTLRGSNKVLVYHGANRGKTLHEFSDYDFVITTYSIVEAEYRKNVMPPKQKCIWCGKLFYEHKISIHLKYFCGPNAIRTNKQSKQKKGKNAELNRSEKGKGVESVDEGKEESSKKGKQYNKDKTLGAGSSTNKSEGAEYGSCNSKSTLHSVKWDRIILDEAHYIKDRRCNTTKAVLALKSSFKWALSGTPLQNRVGELYSLIRFLQISPYSYYFCKDCDCRTLDYSSNTDCPNCPHKSVRHFCWWNKNIATPIQAQGNMGLGRNAMILLKHKILKSILLRRTKKGRAADLALPPRMILLRKDSLDIKEEDYYTSLYNESQAQFNTYVTEGTVMNNYAHIFDLLTRLRQAVDHPYLVVYSKTALSKNANVVDANDGEVICGLCHDSVEDPVVTACAHSFCKSCLIDFSASVGQVSCPSCSKPLTADFSTKKDHGQQETKSTIKGFKRSSILNRIRLHDFQTSTKIDALREEIRFMVERDGSAKGIVFSQFTSFLDLIHYSLQKSGVQCVQLDGSMSMNARDAAITRFTDDPNCRIFLMSLKAGGVALNLTVASHVFLMDPWWNPAVERQAQDRIHRIGQYKPIRIVRFVIEGTIEERILKLQEKKELVFEGTVGGSAEALGKLTEADMKFLFVT